MIQDLPIICNEKEGGPKTVMCLGDQRSLDALEWKITPSSNCPPE